MGRSLGTRLGRRSPDPEHETTGPPGARPGDKEPTLAALSHLPSSDCSSTSLTQFVDCHLGIIIPGRCIHSMATPNTLLRTCRQVCENTVYQWENGAVYLSLSLSFVLQEVWCTNILSRLCPLCTSSCQDRWTTITVTYTNTVVFKAQRNRVWWLMVSDVI